MAIKQILAFLFNTGVSTIVIGTMVLYFCNISSKDEWSMEGSNNGMASGDLVIKDVNNKFHVASDMISGSNAYIDSNHSLYDRHLLAEDSCKLDKAYGLKNWATEEGCIAKHRTIQIKG